MLAEHLGNAIFKDFYLLDNFRGGIQLHTANQSREEIICENWVVVGRSANNPSEVPILNTRAFITPRTDGFRARNIEIFNYEASMTVV